MTEILVPTQGESTGTVYRLKARIVHGREYREDDSRHIHSNGSALRRTLELTQHHWDLPLAHDTELQEEIYGDKSYAVYRRSLFRPTVGKLDASVATGTYGAPRKQTSSMGLFSLAAFARGSENTWVITKPPRDAEGKPAPKVLLPSRAELRNKTTIR